MFWKVGKNRAKVSLVYSYPQARQVKEVEKARQELLVVPLAGWGQVPRDHGVNGRANLLENRSLVQGEGGLWASVSSNSSVLLGQEFVHPKMMHKALLTLFV